MNVSLMSYFSLLQFSYSIQIRFEDIHSSITNGNFTNFPYFINICNLCKIGETIIKICYVLNMNSYPISFGHICFKMFVA